MYKLTPIVTHPDVCEVCMQMAFIVNVSEVPSDDWMGDAAITKICGSCLRDAAVELTRTVVPTKVYTDAPTAYDYAYVGTVRTLPLRRRGNHERVREVIMPAASFKYQAGRYRSGLHLVAREFEFRQLVEAGGCFVDAPLEEVKM